MRNGWRGSGHRRCAAQIESAATLANCRIHKRNADVVLKSVYLYASVSTEIREGSSEAS